MWKTHSSVRISGSSIPSYKPYKLVLVAVLLALFLNTALVPGFQNPPLLYPNDAYAVAWEDVKAAGGDTPYWRYIWIGNQAGPQQRSDLIAAVNFTINSLSKRRMLVPVTPLPMGDGSVLRVDLKAYDIDPDIWDDLGSKGSGPLRSVKKLEIPEPYFHWSKTTTFQEVIEKLVDVPAYQLDGKWYTKKWTKTPGEKKTKTELVHGPWLVPQTAANLVTGTHTDFPLFRAEWFIANALFPPSYQKFLGVKTEADFFNLTRFRAKDDDLAVKAVALISSEVAHHNRSLLIERSVFGYATRSNDYGSSVGKQNLLDDILEDNNVADAHEYIHSLPNELQCYLITDKQRKVVDVGDPQIVSDKNRTIGWEDSRVWTGMSCILCHNKGLKDITDDVRKLADLKKGIFAFPNDKNLARFVDAFGPDQRTKIAEYQGIYAKVMKATNGLTPEKNAANLGKIFLEQVQKPVTLDTVVQDTGYAKEKILEVLRTTKGLEHPLVQLLAEIPIRRDQYEQSYGQLMTLLSGKP
jgi:hypothetical protein